MIAFGIRCVAWALVGWVVMTATPLPAQLRAWHGRWTAAWSVEAPCGSRGLLVRPTLCEEDE